MYSLRAILIAIAGVLTLGFVALSPGLIWPWIVAHRDVISEFQTLIAGTFALIAGLVVLLGAKIGVGGTREQIAAENTRHDNLIKEGRAREARDRNEEKRALLFALRGEIRNIAAQADEQAKVLEGVTDDSWKVEHLRMIGRALSPVFDSSAQRLGIFADDLLTDRLFVTYGNLQTLRLQFEILISAWPGQSVPKETMKAYATQLRKIESNAATTLKETQRVIGELPA